MEALRGKSAATCTSVGRWPGIFSLAAEITMPAMQWRGLLHLLRLLLTIWL